MRELKSDLIITMDNKVIEFEGRIASCFDSRTSMGNQKEMLKADKYNSVRR